MLSGWLSGGILAPAFQGLPFGLWGCFLRVHADVNTAPTARPDSSALGPVTSAPQGAQQSPGWCFCTHRWSQNCFLRNGGNSTGTERNLKLLIVWVISHHPSQDQQAEALALCVLCSPLLSEPQYRIPLFKGLWQGSFSREYCMLNYWILCLLQPNHLWANYPLISSCIFYFLKSSHEDIFSIAF